MIQECPEALGAIGFDIRFVLVWAVAKMVESLLVVLGMIFAAPNARPAVVSTTWHAGELPLQRWWMLA